MTELWDPLWEYVLEDYDHVDEKALRRSSRSQRNSRSSKNGSKGGTKTTRSSYSRNDEDPKLKKAIADDSSEGMGILNMSTWTFFDSNGGENAEYAGDDRDDESARLDSPQTTWNVNWAEDGERKEEINVTQRKGILRRTDSKSSASARYQTSLKSKNKSKRRVNSKPNGRSYTSSLGEEDFHDSGIVKHNSGVSKNKQHISSKSDVEPIYHREVRQNALQQESSGFGDVWDVLTGKPPIAVTPCQESVGSSLPSDAPRRTSAPNVSNGKNRLFPMSLRKSNSEGSSFAIKEKDSMNGSASKGKLRPKMKDQKRVGLFRRRNKQTQEKTISSRNVTSRENLDSPKDIALNDVHNDNKLKEEERTQHTSSFTEFDPMMLLLEVAGKLDPWGVEPSVADSNSETTESETTGINDESSDLSHSDIGPITRRKAGNMEDHQLLDPNNFDPRYAYHPRQPRTPTQTYSTEIRLKVNTVGDTLSEEVYKRSPSISEEESEADVDNSQFWETGGTASIHSSVEETLETRISVHDMSNTRRSFSELSKRSDISEESVVQEGENKHAPFVKKEVDNSAGAFLELGVPLDLHIRREDTDFFRDIDDEDLADLEARGVWKTVCCNVGKKMNRSHDLVNRLKSEDAAALFPTTRMISNGKSRSITGQKADYVNGVMGVPSDHFVESKGPQSLYAYDYDSNEHMDVSYDKIGQKPRASVSVRTLGGPPSLSQFDMGDSVVVQVEASTVSETDCLIRQGKWWHKKQPPLPNTPGADVVGKVFHIKTSMEDKHDLHPRQTVVSLTKWGGNTRYMTIDPNQLVKVPDGLDPAEVACLPNTYLAAFQCLHMGQSGSRRYRENSLKGKSVLIVGCMSNNMGKAIIELALCAGVANIYATCKKKHWKTLISYGVLPLSQDPFDWIQRIEGTIDLVLAPNGKLREDVTPIHFRALLPKQGQLILCGHRIVGNDIPINEWKRDKVPLACGRNKALTNVLNKCHAYDVYESWDQRLEVCKKDLSHLLGLLEGGALKPEVLDRLPLNKVAKAQELIESKRLPGFLVCEPWMRSKKRAVYL
ncbi:oxidoreductase [Nitzschia inconspicua]|uniref:Oxidoreductase n=1 Tax=Nitzschia inconspicua TaxID=303405 RepID=A0A9K3PV70_9STRA|nr:oxidoreductase [Nitzschia inconspicua]